MTRPIMRRKLLRSDTDGGHVELLCPEVGYATGVMTRGSTLSAGMVAATLTRLGRQIDLIVPKGAGGVVQSDAPSFLSSPVEFGQLIVALDPEGVSAASGAGADEAVAESIEGGLAVLASQSGRVWHSPSPGDPPFCKVGDVVKDGAALCLIEVMKTFSSVPYKAEGGLPHAAKVVRWLVDDGGDIKAGAPLLIVEAE